MCARAGRTNDQLLADVIAELHRLSKDGIAPSSRQWNAHRKAHVPADQRMRRMLDMTYTEAIAAAGLQVAERAKVNTGLAADIEHHVTAGAELADWNSRYHAALHVLPTPTRRETVQGRTISGEPCVIHREYWMVR